MAGNGSIKHKETRIFYSGFGDESHEFGVGFMINRGFMTNHKLLHNVNRFEALNERICFIHLIISGHNIIIINCHSPTGDKNGDGQDAFHDELETTCDSLPNALLK